MNYLTFRIPQVKEEIKEGSRQNVYDDERPPSPAKDEEEEEGLSISIELPRCNIALGKELYFIKLPNFLSVDTKPFDAGLYEDEIEEDEILDEEGRARLKLKVQFFFSLKNKNYVRFKFQGLGFFLTSLDSRR